MLSFPAYDEPGGARINPRTERIGIWNPVLADCIMSAAHGILRKHNLTVCCPVIKL